MAAANRSTYEVSLSFVDLLYAVPVADLAILVSQTELHMTAAGWTDVLLPLVAITLGWIGHHSNRGRLPDAIVHERFKPQTPFWGARFIQFMFEVGIVGAYFALGTRLHLHLHHDTPTEVWKAVWLLAIFVMYFGWDLLDIHITRKIKKDKQRTGKPREDGELARWLCRATLGGTITLVFVFVFVVVLMIAIEDLHHDFRTVFIFDTVAICILYLYRLTQQCVTKLVPAEPTT